MDAKLQKKLAMAASKRVMALVEKTFEGDLTRAFVTVHRMAGGTTQLELSLVLRRGALRFTATAEGVVETAHGTHRGEWSVETSVYADKLLDLDDVAEVGTCATKLRDLWQSSGASAMGTLQWLANEWACLEYGVSSETVEVSSFTRESVEVAL
jgi:hypothetical protein